MNPLRSKIAKCLIIRHIRRKLKRKLRSCNARPIFQKRLEAGENMLIKDLEQDPEYHKKYFRKRMTKEDFQEIYDEVKHALYHQNTHASPISPLERFAITLRYLASGSTQTSVGLSYRESPSSVSKILRETMNVICEYLTPRVLPNVSEETWITSEKGFCSKWNFLNCCGSIDGKHIRIQAPKYSGSMNYNYKGYFSIVLLAIVDPYYKFIAVYIGASGSLSDRGVLSRSIIGQSLDKETFKLPRDKLVGDFTLPHVIVGDDAFPLKKYLMKPYPGRNLDKDKRIFNYRLSRARMVAECAFGILVNRWRILHSTIIGEIGFAQLIVKTTVVLHNFLMSKHENNLIDVTH